MSINGWGSDFPMDVPKGGTGNASLTDHGVLIGEGASALSVSGAPTNGQLLVGGTGVNPAWANVTGVTDEISVAEGAGTLTLGLADDAVIPDTGAVSLPSGTTGERPTPANGDLRYNETTTANERYEPSAWTSFAAGSGTSSGSWVHVATVTTSSVTSWSLSAANFGSSYNNYVVAISDFTMPTGTAAQVTMTISESGVEVTTGYYSVATAVSSAAASTQLQNSTNWNLTRSAVPSTTDRVNLGYLYLFGFNTSGNAYFTNQSTNASSSCNASTGYNSNTTTADGLNFTSAYSSSGTFKIYGIAS